MRGLDSVFLMYVCRLRSCDGSAVVCGRNGAGQYEIPALDGQLTYTQVAVGSCHFVILRSGGSALACGYYNFEQSSYLALDDQLAYAQAATSQLFWRLLLPAVWLLWKQIRC